VRRAGRQAEARLSNVGFAFGAIGCRHGIALAQAGARIVATHATSSRIEDRRSHESRRGASPGSRSAK